MRLKIKKDQEMGVRNSFFALLGIFFLINPACSVKKDADGGGAQDPHHLQRMDLTLKETDWNFLETTTHGIGVKIKTLKPEKLSFIQKNFSVPELTEVTVPESNGFEIYRVKNVADLENKVLIHPKMFISSSTERGSILGYKTGERDERGRELITISIPVALVNGLVPALQVTGGGSHGQGAGMTLPERYRISDVPALLARVAPSTLETLPVCPTHFTLKFHGREYRARSPFENLSICPTNQFFRITFQAPKIEMGELLETAAIQEDSVSITADLQVNFAVPKKAVELSIRPDAFRQTLLEDLSHLESQNALNGAGALHSLQEIESSVAHALFTLSQLAGVQPEVSENLGHYVNALIDRFFSASRACPRGGICRAMGARVTDRSNIRYQWTEAETIASSIRTQSIVSLGAVANSSSFLSKPSRSILDGANRPAYFRGRTLNQIIQDCTVIIPGGYEDVFPGIPETDRPYVESFCRNILPYLVPNPDDPEQTDGYFPLGANTTVYPGAWLKIDIERIEEFTTAKTREDADHHMIIESEIIDMLATDPNARGTACIAGDNIACMRYAQKQIDVRDHQGNQIEGDIACQRGEPGCVCQTVDGVERCTRRGYLFQSVMDYECDPGDVVEYCPYYRTEEKIIGYKKDYDCHEVKFENTSFLCLNGCSERYELQCDVRSSEPIKANRDVPNCIGDDPAGRFPRVTSCKRPHYICEQWSQNCTRYAVNESFQIVHEEIAPKWRRFSIDQGEYPRRFEDQISLKFVSPRGTVSNCPLSQFGGRPRGNTWYIKLPTEANDYQPCGVPLWNGDNNRALFLPKVYIKNSIRYFEKRLCGNTEYQNHAQEIPAQRVRASTVPPAFRAPNATHIGPVQNSCRHENSIAVGSDLSFRETPPIRFSGKVSVLGRMLESIVNQENHIGGL